MKLSPILAIGVLFALPRLVAGNSDNQTLTGARVYAGSVGPVVPLPKLAFLRASWEKQPSETSCSPSVDLGYSISLHGHIYKVKGTGPAGPNQLLLFFNENGTQITDLNVLQQLAAAAWARENVVASAEARNGSHRVSAILGASNTLQGYSTIQDALAREIVRALEAAVTDGASLNDASPNLASNMVANQLKSAPSTIFMLAAQRGLQESLVAYRRMEAVPLPPSDATLLNASDLIQIKNLYFQARTLEGPYEALAAKLVPSSVSQLTDAELAGAISQSIASIESHNLDPVTLHVLLDLQKRVANLKGSPPALQGYGQNLNVALNLVDANNLTIFRWIAASAAGCSEMASNSGNGFASEKNDPSAAGTGKKMSRPNGPRPASATGSGAGNSSVSSTRVKLPKWDLTQAAPPVVHPHPDATAGVDTASLTPPDFTIPNPNLDKYVPSLSTLVNLWGRPSGSSGNVVGTGGGEGRGVGPSAGGGYFHPGIGGVGYPSCEYCPDAKYSEEARAKAYQGTVVLQALISAEGRAIEIQVIKGPGLGLEEKAVEAVKEWRFKPALRPDGLPVPVVVPIEVTFRLLRGPGIFDPL